MAAILGSQTLFELFCTKHLLGQSLAANGNYKLPNMSCSLPLSRDCQASRTIVEQIPLRRV